MPDPNDQAPSLPPQPLSEKTKAEMALGQKLIAAKEERNKMLADKVAREEAAATEHEVQVTPPSNKKGKKN